jgi:hypothetical protein
MSRSRNDSHYAYGSQDGDYCTPGEAARTQSNSRQRFWRLTNTTQRFVRVSAIPAHSSRHAVGGAVRPFTMSGTFAFRTLIA